MLQRRGFLRKSLLAGGAVFASRYTSLAQVPKFASSRIEVLLEEPLATISPNIYGHFIEHLGGVIYDGLWVGEGSKIAHEHGLRKSVIEHLRSIQAPVIRYPGGCFADSYDWKDGIGPQDRRPRRTNFWIGSENDQSPPSHKYEPNAFGTNEFIRLCKLTGSQPYLAANLRSLPAEDFYRWVEYCNSPSGSTTMADLRIAAGFREPFGVKYWGIGNESWGCGGNFTAQQYAIEFRRFTTWAPGFGQPLSFIASGPNGDDRLWTRGFLEEIVRKGAGQLRQVYGLSLHHYASNLSRGRSTDWEASKGDALNFEPVDWYELLREGDRIDGMIGAHWQVMEEFDRDHRVKLIVDEWGPWYKPGSEATPGNILEQIPTLRDAVFSAMTLDIFNRHPEKVAMANCAQLINCLNSLYLAHEDKFVVTPVGQVFELYAAHQGGQAVRTIFSAPPIDYDRDGKTARFWGLNGSSSIKGKTLLLTVVNPHVSAPHQGEIMIHRSTAKSATATVLTGTGGGLGSRNTFDNPHGVVSANQSIKMRDNGFVFDFPPASVSRISVELA